MPQSTFSDAVMFSSWHWIEKALNCGRYGNIDDKILQRFEMYSALMSELFNKMFNSKNTQWMNVNSYRWFSWPVEEKQRFNRLWSEHWFDLVILLQYWDLTGEEGAVVVSSTWETTRRFRDIGQALGTTAGTSWRILRSLKLSAFTLRAACS